MLCCPRAATTLIYCMLNAVSLSLPLSVCPSVFLSLFYSLSHSSPCPLCLHRSTLSASVCVCVWGGVLCEGSAWVKRSTACFRTKHPWVSSATLYVFRAESRFAALRLLVCTSSAQKCQNFCFTTQTLFLYLPHPSRKTNKVDMRALGLQQQRWENKKPEKHEQLDRNITVGTCAAGLQAPPCCTLWQSAVHLCVKSCKVSADTALSLHESPQRGLRMVERSHYSANIVAGSIRNTSNVILQGLLWCCCWCLHHILLRFASFFSTKPR